MKFAITGPVRAGMQVAGKRPSKTAGGSTWSSAARHRLVFDDADVRGRRMAWPSRATSTRVGTAPPRPACWPSPGSTTISSRRWPSRRPTRPRRFENGPGDEDALVPPVNNVNQMEKVLGFPRAHAVPRFHRGRGKRQGDRGFTSIPRSGRTQDDEMIQNEIFGPVADRPAFMR